MKTIRETIRDDISDKDMALKKKYGNAFTKAGELAIFMCNDIKDIDINLKTVKDGAYALYIEIETQQGPAEWTVLLMNENTFMYNEHTVQTLIDLIDDKGSESERQYIKMSMENLLRRIQTALAKGGK